MIVSLRISIWTGKAQDTKVTREIEASHHAKDAGRFIKNLISEEHLKKVTKAGNALRALHYDYTLPWDDSGRRLLPAANYFEYMTKIKALESDFNQLASDLVNGFEHHKAEAKRNLNGMFNENDYPTLEELTGKFGVKVNISPIEDSTDFRVMISEQEVKAIQADIEASITECLNDAQRDIFTRMRTAIETMKERLSTKDAIFRDSLVDNIRDLVTLIPRLNVTSDPQITAICQDMQALVIPPETLRKSTTIRADIAGKAADILGKYSFSPQVA